MAWIAIARGQQYRWVDARDAELVSAGIKTVPKSETAASIRGSVEAADIRTTGEFSWPGAPVRLAFSTEAWSRVVIQARPAVRITAWSQNRSFLSPLVLLPTVTSSRSRDVPSFSMIIQPRSSHISPAGLLVPLR